MAKHKGWSALTLVLVLIGSARAPGAEPAAPPPVPKPPTLAVLTFQSTLKEPDQSGTLMADILSARLSVSGDVVVVERVDIEKILKEQQLTLSGLVAPDQAAKVGKLLGAQLLLTGRVTAAGKMIYVICKIINTETGQVKGMFLNLPITSTFDEVLDKTGTKLSDMLPKWTRQLIPAKKRTSDVEKLKALLAGKQPPSIAVLVAEEHLAAPVIDPAVQTEFEKLLTEAGVRPTTVDKATAKKLTASRGDLPKLARLLAGTRYLLLGEAFSEPGGRVRGMIIGTARAEVKIIDLAEQKILWSDRATGRAPDLTEHLAAKTALQKAGRILAMRLLPELFKQLPDKKKKLGKQKTKAK